MKIGFVSKVTVVGKNVREYDKKDGSGKGKSYTLAIMQDGQCANIGCNEEVYNTVLPDLNKPFTLGGVYDDIYNRFLFDIVILNDAVTKPATAK